MYYTYMTQFFILFFRKEILDKYENICNYLCNNSLKRTDVKTQSHLDCRNANNSVASQDVIATSYEIRNK